MIKQELPPDAGDIKYTYLGETRTLKEWAKLAEISAEALYNRLQAGWEIDEAIRIPEGGLPDQTYKYAGCVYSINDIAGKFNISYSSLRRRLREGRNIADAVSAAVLAKDSLCWRCKNAYGRCSWSSLFIPVDGWTAIETHKSQTAGVSYHVLKCPEFVTDEKWVKEE